MTVSNREALERGRTRSPRVDLVVTACEGREHLLVRTIASLRVATKFQFDRVILACDGQLHAAAIAEVSPEVVVQNWHRRGYVASIMNVVRQLDGDFFFWLEDDWSFTRPIDVERLRDALIRHPEWVQIRLSKAAPLSASERDLPLGGGFHESASGFSANPSLNRTSQLQGAVESLRSAPRERLTGFEPYFAEWFRERQLKCVVDDPGNVPAVGHEGYLESTPRQFHMLASLAGELTNHVAGIPTDSSLLQRGAMFARLLARAMALGIRQLRDAAAYELAFRIVNLPIPPAARRQSTDVPRQ